MAISRLDSLVPETRLTVETVPAITKVRHALVVAAVLIEVGAVWDIAWHQSIGRDTFWSPPHMVQYASVLVVGLFCSWLILRTTFAGTSAARGAMVRFWGFRGPMGAWVCIWGTFAMLVSAPFDNWWHSPYGLDVKIVSPPHMMLAAGMISIIVGALLMTLAAQNHVDALDSRSARWSYAFTGGLVIFALSIGSFEYTGYPNLWHSKAFYLVAAAIFSLLLACIARTGRLRWPATAAAGFFMLTSLLLNWTLQLFPATPRLAPIQNPVTHLVPMPFPILLVVPAIAFDVLHRRWNGRGDWRLAAFLGATFVITFAAASWPMAAFLLSPSARNQIFLADQWAYFVRLGPWRYKYWDSVRGIWAGQLATPIGVGFLTAMLVGTISARVGLAFGNWMRQVRR